MVEVVVNKHVRQHPDLPAEARAIVRLMNSLMTEKLVRPVRFEVKVLQVMYDPSVDGARDAATTNLVAELKKYGTEWFADLDASFDNFGQVVAYDLETHIRVRLHHALTAVAITCIAMKSTTDYFKSQQREHT